MIHPTLITCLSNEQLLAIEISLQKEMERGLTQPDQPLRMLHSYVDHQPTGQEQGNYLAIDFGGTNMRLVHVALEGSRRMKTEQKKWKIPEQLKRGSCKQLFNWIVDGVEEFVGEHLNVPFNGKIGFCFSFPLHQIALNSAILLQWNKGFDIPQAVGCDIAVLLEQGMKQRGLKFRVGAIVNDTVAVLLARSYEQPTCKVGAVVGTGFNAAYWEEWSAAPKLAPDRYAVKMKTIISTEIGGMPLAFIDDIDKELDKESENPGKQLLEKRVSGMYMGELFQRACAKQNITLKDYSALSMNLIEMTQIGTEAKIADSISTRSVQHVAVSLAAILQKQKWTSDPVEIAFEGSMVEKYHEYNSRIKGCLRQEFGIENVQLTVVDGLAAVGATVAAALPN